MERDITRYYCSIVKMRRQASNSLTASDCWMGNKKAWDTCEVVGLAGYCPNTRCKILSMGQAGWGC